jgi:hypothetical protein
MTRKFGLWTNSAAQQERRRMQRTAAQNDFACAQGLHPPVGFDIHADGATILKDDFVCMRLAYDTQI